MMESLTAETTIPCFVLSNHPRAEGKPLRWNARAERVETDILVIHNGLPFLTELPALAERYPETFELSSVIGVATESYKNDKHRNSKSFVLSGASEEFVFYDLLCRTVEARFISTYRNLVNDHALVTIGSGYELLRYREGEYFKVHVDTVKDHPQLGHRRVAVVAFCNGDFEGGELHFPRQNLTIKPEPGMVVLFPATFTHPHESLPVTRGTKYSVVTWFF